MATLTVSPTDEKRVKALGFLSNKGTDNFSGRIITVNGKITAAQQRCIAEAAEKFGNGVVTFTTRLTIEVQGIPYDKIEDFRAFLREAGLEKALCPGPGQLLLAKAAGLRPYGDYGLNVLNSCALRACRDLGAEDMTLSFETNLRQGASLGDYLPCGVIAYGYLPLMTFRACPIQGDKGCGGCRGEGILTDRLGKEFPVLCHRRRYSQLLNTVPLYLGDKQDVLIGFSHVTLRFTTESGGRCERVVQLWREGAPLREERTNGLYFRELK